ncbi:MAG: hypothetical protein M0T78_10245 [Actinomycetota bacterium]|nr:hypothetical protein [Actinomycetota bacterium]
MTVPFAYFATTSDGGATWIGKQIAYRGQLAVLGSNLDVILTQEGTNFIAESPDRQELDGDQ